MMQTEQTEQTTSTNIVQATITPFSLSLPTDQEWLTPNLCLLRQQLEVFSATAHDVAERRTGTKPPLGSIGMRCKHCAHRREKKAVRGAVVYPASLSQIHQAVRNFHRHHFYSCPDIPDDVKERMRGFKKKENQSRRNAARYWIWSSREMLGMMDVDGAEGVSGSEGRTKAKVRRPHIRFRDGFVNGGTATTVGGGGGTSTRDSDTKGSTSTDRSITSTATGTNGPGPTNSAIPTTATASRAAAAAGATAADLTTCIGDGGRERIDSSTESVLSLADSALEGIEDTDVDISGVAIDDLLEHDLLTDTSNQTQVTRTTCTTLGATADDIDVAEESQVDEENNQAGANPTEEPRPERTDTNGPTTSAVPATASRAAAAGATAADLTTCIGDVGRERIDSTESVLSLEDSALEGINDVDDDISSVAIDDLLEHDLLTDDQTQVTRTTCTTLGATADDIDVAEESQVDEENNRAGAGANPTEEPWPERRHRGSHHGAGPATDTNGPTTSAGPATASRAAAGATAADLTTCVGDGGRERIDSTESVLSLADSAALEGIEDVDDDISGVAIDDLLEHYLLSDTDNQTQVTRTTALGATADDDVAEESQVDEENNRAGANPTEEPRPERRHHGSYHGAGPECRNARNGRANIHNIWSSFAAASLPVSMEERTLPRMAAAAQRPQPKTANEERDYQMTLECQPAYTPLDEQEDIAALTIPDLYELQSDLSGITAGVAGINLNGGPSATKVVASDIARLDVEMSKLPPIHTAAYRQALEICPELISDERKMEFLECEDNDPALAATRLATHWNLRLEIFGPDRCFLPTTLAGAMQDEVDNMINRKVQQPLPVTDTAGRAIIFVSPARRNLDEYSMKQECMVAWYLLESFSQHPFVRKRGAVFIVDGRNYQRNFVSKYLKLFVSVMFRALPIKTRAYHLLSPSRIGRYFLEPVIRHFLDRDIRLRFKTHYGSLSRVLVDLQGYGLPRDRLPTEVGGTVVLDMKQWVMDRLALESSRLTQLPPTCTTELHSETHLPDKDITNPNRNASTSTSSQDKEKKRKQNRDADDSDDDSFLEVIKSLPGLGNDIDMDNDDVSL